VLGELVAEETGQTIGTRVLPSIDGEPPRIEISFQATGTLLGATTVDMGTYTATMHDNGITSGQGQGVTTTPQGEVLTWKGYGVGQQVNGTTQYRGTVFYETSAAKFARLNGVACVFEYDVDEGGKTTGSLWEWK
jgi:hypothetical protein